MFPVRIRFAPTVKSPVVVTVANVTADVFDTACPIAIVGVEPSPVLLVIVTPVPGTTVAV